MQILQESVNNPKPERSEWFNMTEVWGGAGVSLQDEQEPHLQRPLALRWGNLQHQEISMGNIRLPTWAGNCHQLAVDQTPWLKFREGFKSTERDDKAKSGL